MATGISRSTTADIDSFKRSFTLGSEETFDLFCNPCEKRNNSKVVAEFYCSVCDDFCCQPCGQVHNSFKGNISHPVYGRDQLNMWGVHIRNAMLPTEVCPDHEESLKMMCLNHSKLCCSVCVSLHHRACPEMVYVPNIAKDISKSQDLSIVSQTIDQAMQHINEMIGLDKKCQKLLDKSQMDFFDNIKELRRQVNDYFYDLEKSTSNDMNVFHNDKKDLLQQHLNNLYDSKDKLTNIQTAIQPSSAKTESQLFIGMIKANEHLPECLHNLQKLAQTPQTTHFHLNPNPQLQQLLATITNIGEMKVDIAVLERKLPKLIPLPLLSVTQSSLVIESDVLAHKAQQQQQQQQQLQQTLYKASNSRKINIKIESDKSNCDIYGICQMPNGDTLLADRPNKKVKRLSTYYTPTDYLDLPASNNALCCMGDTEAAVTDDNSTIHFLSITRDKMSVTRSMKLDHTCNGIAHYNGRLFVTDLRSKNIYIYTTSGKCLKTVKTDTNGEYIFSDTRHVCVSPDGSKIYVADWDKGLVILDSEGNYISTYSSRKMYGALASPYNMSSACCVCVDTCGRVMLCGFWSNNVLQLENGGIPVGQVVGIFQPSAICIDAHNSTLIVARGYNSITVYDLK